MIRVAHLLPTLEIGGRERTAIELARAGAALGIAPLLITHERAPEGRAMLSPGAVPHVALDSRAGDFDARLRAVLESRGTQLVHAHGHVTAIHAAHLPVPRLATLHVAPGMAWRWALPIARALRRMNALAAVSDDLARRFAPLAGRRPLTIATGIDLARYPPAPARRGEGLVIGMLSRLHPVKRHQDALAAVALLRARGIDARLAIAGDGPMEARLRTATRGLPHVELAGPATDSAAFFARIDAFLLCSGHEGMPLALIEAMASGLPCVATAVGGVPDLVGPDGALLVPARRPAALADALAGLHDEERRRTLGEAARRRAQHFSIDRQAMAYAALYRSLVTAGGSSVPSSQRKLG
ncbi:glycosyltransferase family 4 protein [Flavisphingomonas formosensis]|uniref:glycosyltransferase family 4 protein n=1 Tax=Flavisphingomonas formosensis TaxID=861534 RepID=UPI0012F72C7F|nr:glycosyltransferase family 4 protein [Sphingomonas formosensis]